MTRRTGRTAALVACAALLSAACILAVTMGGVAARRALAGDAGQPGAPASYVSHGKTIAVEVFRPTGTARLPAVLLLHGADCLQVPAITAGYRLNARRLARRGYVVLMVHYMDRTGTKATGPADMARNFAPWMETVRDGITYARSRPDVVADHTGLVGVSLGATLAVCVGGVDDRVGAVVEYFGGLPEAAVPRLERMPPVLILHGDADWLVNVREAHKLDRVLTQHGLPHEMHIYHGQGHGFTGEADRDSAERTVAFLDRYLKPRTAPAAKGSPAAAAVPRPRTGAPRRSPMLHRQGIRIVDGNGREVRLRGVSLGGWLVWEGWIFGKGILTPQSAIVSSLRKAAGPAETERFRAGIYDGFITEADIRQIAGAGFNCVRVPLHYRLFDTDAGWRYVDRLLDWCERNRIYAVLDLHMVPGSSLGSLEPAPVWSSEDSRRKVIDVWRSIAARYHARKVVAGYDLLGEPMPPSGPPLVSLYRRIIAAVREVDPDHLLILEGSKFATDFSMFDAPLDPNQAYSFHMYNWFGDDRRKKLAEYVALARRQDVPLWVGEFGENKYDMIRSTVDLYARYPEINGWAFWTWKKAPSAYPGLVTIRVPKDWAKTMDWVASLFGLGQPSADTVRSGMRQFVEAAKLTNCDYDVRMERALLHTPR